MWEEKKVTSLSFRAMGEKTPLAPDQTQELPLCLLQFASSVDFQQVFSLSGSTKQNSQNFRSLSCPFGVAWAKTVASHHMWLLSP